MLIFEKSIFELIRKVRIALDKCKQVLLRRIEPCWGSSDQLKQLKSCLALRCNRGVLVSLVVSLVVRLGLRLVFDCEGAREPHRHEPLVPVEVRELDEMRRDVYKIDRVAVHSLVLVDPGGFFKRGAITAAPPLGEQLLVRPKLAAREPKRVAVRVRTFGTPNDHWNDPRTEDRLHLLIRKVVEAELCDEIGQPFVHFMRKKQLELGLCACNGWKHGHHPEHAASLGNLVLVLGKGRHQIRRHVIEGSLELALHPALFELRVGLELQSSFHCIRRDDRLDLFGRGTIRGRLRHAHAHDIGRLIRCKRVVAKGLQVQIDRFFHGFLPGHRSVREVVEGFLCVDGVLGPLRRRVRLGFIPFCGLKACDWLALPRRQHHRWRKLVRVVDVKHLFLRKGAFRLE